MSVFAIEGWIKEVATTSDINKASCSPTSSFGITTTHSRKSREPPLSSDFPIPSSKRLRLQSPHSIRQTPKKRRPRQPLADTNPNISPAAMSSREASTIRKSPKRRQETAHKRGPPAGMDSRMKGDTQDVGDEGITDEEPTPRSKISVGHVPVRERGLRKGAQTSTSLTGSPTRRPSALVDEPPSWASRLATSPSPFSPRHDLQPSISSS